jgi:very-short-patch-repair endonuclease
MSRLRLPQTYRARQLRRAATPAEQALWVTLRGRQLEGAKFRRPIGPFIADFFCEEAGLVIEADGAAHFPPPSHDIHRDAWLRSFGLTVLRLANDEILRHPERARERICSVLRRVRAGRV